jgi:hypothetical protein
MKNQRLRLQLLIYLKENPYWYHKEIKILIVQVKVQRSQCKKLQRLSLIGKVKDPIL